MFQVSLIYYVMSSEILQTQQHQHDVHQLFLLNMKTKEQKNSKRRHAMGVTVA